ncbi:flagellar biosynthesis anti-sigma factor FlgM [Ethanoligenens harbinense]|uniref:Anti-sigma-28 factor FlgM family protein n=1 Tax=Ethanoligenens harbinense (strain DSM 18485 / JCM 12961 / CGMCC 1.5033 / YUAN-3) TaxID=663278 RepID=E6U6H8_ETHHY|nr:flagellar biosynthesis anti-sigma factor FlgM [Ethanoligenens harbinense]ADU28048.1 Anti-sigma-28 factor FlgM family protein [Ethanoligenens harbinense YUAN-3]AVQ97065.1 hypothetical protein CXQ68_13125 [Ethanoligenens harbinense YUAN-3]AYF39727.1 hypothetical protein CXP51_13025 [Ethanoligenens harbinense]AYF42560.1 hypothetical protein CN246_13605 [Ethanoligenens harbinense]QCN93308.1 flagellar biosynthesis anti-sigma factor FlgM [Ethanoligenens harbinense]
MKIDGFQPHQVYASFSKEEKDTKPAQVATEPAQAGSVDRVEISAEAADKQATSRLAGQITDASDAGGRAERIAAIKKQVQDGTYSVPAEDVAAGILGARIDRKA